MASASGRPPPGAEVSISGRDTPMRVQLLKQLEWVRNRRKEIQIAILYEKKKLESMETGEEEPASVTQEDLDVIQPKLQKAVDKAAMLNTMLKKLQMSDMLNKFASLTGEEKEKMRDPQRKDQPTMETFVEENMVLSKDILDLKNKINELTQENIRKELSLSEMSQERYILMQKYWKKNKKAEDSEAKRATSIKRKNLEKKISMVKKVLTVNNHVFQLVAGSSGIDWSKDPDLLSIMLECGKPIDEQLRSVS